MTASSTEQARSWTERLERADALFAEGNISGAAKLAREVEDEAERERKRAGVGSASRRDAMRVIQRARGMLERYENIAGAGDDEDDDA